jgi:cytochrome P460
MMKRSILLLIAATTVAGAISYFAVASEHAEENSAPIFLSEIPQGYREWKLIAVSRLASPKGAQLRAQLGTDIAIKAYQEGKLPFPDGAMIVALHWDEIASENNKKVLAQGFPGAGIQSFVPGSGVNMQFMVKDSKKYAATGGWGFGDFTNGKPGDEKLMKPASPATCRPKIATSSLLVTHLEPI